jgi:HSP20 family protein
MKEMHMATPLAKQASNGGSPLVPRDPFHTFRQEMNSLMDRMFGRSLGFFDMPAFDRLTGGTGAVVPQIDIHETDSEIVLTAELPGVDEKDVDLSIHNGVLTLKGEKRYEKTEGEGDARVVERHYGNFERSFTLPSGIDDAKIVAKYDKGVLKITLPKSAEARKATRHISISAN